jgi:hypothetical protein
MTPRTVAGPKLAGLAGNWTCSHCLCWQFFDINDLKAIEILERDEHDSITVIRADCLACGRQSVFILK